MDHWSFRLDRIACAFLWMVAAGWASGSTGIFDQVFDVGAVEHAGEAEYMEVGRRYRVKAGGENIWGERDAFSYLAKESSDDLDLSVDVDWIGDGVNPHRKAGWMIRDGLAPDAPYVDVMVHGDGLISMQFRRLAGGQTDEVQAPVRNPASIRLQRTGDNFVFWVRERGGPFVRYGTVVISLPRRVFVGLAVCSHDASVDETALFSNVDMKEFVPTAAAEVLESTLEIMNIETGVRRVVYRAQALFEAPNWSPDGQTLYFNSKGRIYRIPLEGGVPQVVPTDFADRCNNDHGLSPDGKTLAISHHEDDLSYIYVVPVEGGTPKKITQEGPSYWHGWAPDGRSVVYCAEREGEFDVYSQSLSGGDEVRLTSASGLDDGPEYAPDGATIFFNSERTGSMRIWAMDPNGENQRQMTFNKAFSDWFPHPSPDGKWVVFLSYDSSVQGHPANKEVTLRLMPQEGGEARVLTRILGGQGTINVPSWAPDSKHFAFVSYRWTRPAL